MRGPSQVRFQVTVRQNPTRGAIGQAIKAIVIKVAQVAADKAVSLLLPKLAEAFEKRVWQEARTQGRVAEGHKRHVGCWRARIGQARRRPSALSCSSTERFRTPPPRISSLARSSFFDRVKDTYADRIFAFNHFSVSRTPGAERPHAAQRLCRSRARRSTSSPIAAAVSSSATSWSARKPFGDLVTSFQARSRGAGGVAERRHAARDAETVGRDHRLAGQPARAVSGQPVHDGRGVRRQRAGLAGQSCVGRSSGSAARWTARET